VQNCQINTSILNEIPSKHKSEWPSFSKKKLRNTIDKCNNSSTPRPDHVLWKHLKDVLKNNRYLHNIINITNTYINLGYWPLYFKNSLSIIIFKPNKLIYNSSKIFHSIVLLNTLGKLIEKIISERLQKQSIVSNFIYPNQLGGLK